MEQKVKIGVIDEPVSKVNGSKDDQLDITKYTNALTAFIRSTLTPITIGVQGEWGSGKTSLLNSIWYDLNKNSEYKQIWINAWENSLLTSPENALVKIVNEIIFGITSGAEDIAKVDKIKRNALGLAKGALRIGAAFAGGAKAGQVADEWLSEDEGSIKKLRESLDDLAKEVVSRSNNPIKKIIVFVDDLDRIEPKDAVKILELLKNIFSIKHCVFVLAIDYQVIVKGLKDKFGEMTDKNEWEFRAFFDKIIQLPFMMPMSAYRIDKYVTHLLSEIGYSFSNESYISKVKDILSYSIGGNPRSLKRLINSLSLIKIFEFEQASTDSDKFMLFSLLCIQISYPQIYDALQRRPDFKSWDESLSFEITQRRENIDPNFQALFEEVSQTDDFDEEWERSLFRIGFVVPYLRRRIMEVSRLLSIVSDAISQQGQVLEELVMKALNISSVTSVASSEESIAHKKPHSEYTAKRIEGLKESGVKEYVDQVISNITNAGYTVEAFDQAMKETHEKDGYVGFYVQFNDSKIRIYTGKRKKFSFYVDNKDDASRFENAGIELIVKNTNSPYWRISGHERGGYDEEMLISFLSFIQKQFNAG